MKDLLSIIVPCYNVENYIENTLSSICNQTYQNIEIILVDDGSKDCTPQLLDRLATQDKRVRVIHKINAGVTKARMTGVQNATGKWIGFVDADDYIEPDMYERLMNNAELYDADISHCGYRMVYPSKVEYYYNTGRLITQNKESGVNDLITGVFVEPGLCNKIFKKQLFEKSKIDTRMDYSIKNTEDLLANYYLFEASEKSIYEDFCPYHYILRKGSAATSRENPNKLWDPVRVLLVIERETENNSSLAFSVRKRLVAKLINVAAYYSHENVSWCGEYRKLAHRELKSRLKGILSGQYSSKQKLFALWAVYLPKAYFIVHKMYGAITGSNRKYEVK